MTFSIACPECGEQFRNIKPEMAGKKARCRCGTIVRLGPKRQSNRDSSKKTASQSATDFGAKEGNDDLVGDESLGDLLLGGALDETSFKTNVGVESAKPKTATKSVSKTSSKSVANGRPSSSVVEVPIVAVPPLGLAHPEPAKVKRQSPKPKSHPTDSPGKPPASEIDRAYADLDDILGGQGDAAPLVIRNPSSASQSGGAPTNSSSSGTPVSPRPSTVGLLAAVTSATLAFWFGIVGILSRFNVVDVLLVDGFSESLQSVYLAVFGLAEVAPTYQVIFKSLGWVFWAVAVGLALFALAQFINAILKVLVGRSIIGWSDGLTASMAVCAVLLMMAMVFTHIRFTKNEHRLLDEYEKPTVLDHGPIGNIESIRIGLDEDAVQFQKTMLIGAAVPMSVFFLCMLRLFLNMPEPVQASDVARGGRAT